MAINKHIGLQPVYVVGTHLEFVTELGKKIAAVMQKQPPGKTTVHMASHAFAFAPDGQMHWSAFVSFETLTDEDDGRQA